jgi:uncharacterized protein
MDFEWDIYKAIANQLKHRIGFNEAIAVFYDEGALVTRLPKRSADSESRFQAIGGIIRGQKVDPLILSVVFTIRHETKMYRLISARPASRRERKLYELQNRSRKPPL